MIWSKKKNEEKQIKARQRIQKMTEEIGKIWSGEDTEIPTDVSGSYTGNPTDDVVPLQDADDL